METLLNVEMNLGFYKMLGNYQAATQLVASRVVPSSIELVMICGSTPLPCFCGYRINVSLRVSNKCEDIRQKVGHSCYILVTLFSKL
jgi:hypothetical protein